MKIIDWYLQNLNVLECDEIYFLFSLENNEYTVANVQTN